jgi:DNA-binding MarR family transcriptional regulator
MTLASISEITDDTGERYRDNFARHLLGVTLYLQSDIMDSLTRECGHRDLRINFEPYITIIGSDGARLSDIADCLGISRQAANQTANQIEAAGYIKRQADPQDGRAKLLMATRRGVALRRDGTREAARLQQQMEDIVCADAIKNSIDALAILSDRLGLLLPSSGDTAGAYEARLAGLLPRLRNYINLRLMHLTAARGHPALKQSFGQVLTAIGPAGGRIQQMAQTQGVSKQAISAVVTELEDLGYIRRVPDQADARQVLVRFTGKGHRLIADSVASVDEIDKEFEELIGRKALDALYDCMRMLYRALHLEEDIFDNTAPVDIRVLAKQLTHQLGEEGASALGRLLLEPTGTER